MTINKGAKPYLTKTKNIYTHLLLINYICVS
jgi:hypothetical protein